MIVQPRAYWVPSMPGAQLAAGKTLARKLRDQEGIQPVSLVARQKTPRVMLDLRGVHPRRHDPRVEEPAQQRLPINARGLQARAQLSGLRARLAQPFPQPLEARRSVRELLLQTLLPAEQTAIQLVFGDIHAQNMFHQVFSG